MPLIDLKSDLSAKVTTALNDNERRVEDSKRLANFLFSGKGALFAAKQGMLDADIKKLKLNPTITAKRLASISAQIGLNAIPFGLGNHIGFDPNGPGLSQAVSGTAEEVSVVRDRTSTYKNLAKNTTEKYDTQDLHQPTRIPLEDKETDYTSIVANDTDWVKYQTEDVYLAEQAIERDLTVKEAMLRDADLGTIPFFFTSYSISNGQLTNGPSLAFPAFFNNIQDSVNGNWNSFNYTGRGELFHVYQTYGRTLTMGFKVAAFNYQELRSINTKLSKLRSTAAPTYSSTTGYMKGTFLKLTIGDFVRSLPGFITSVGFTVSDNIPWETANGKLKIPHVVDVSVSYTVVEQNTPQFSF